MTVLGKEYYPMLSKATSMIFTILFLLFIFGTTAYLETTTVKEEDTSGFLTSIPTVHEDEVTIADDQIEDGLLNSMIPTLEDKLVDTQLIDGYVVEEYREYEVYRDQEGKILKSVPTTNYSYIKYMKN
jgi:hypothetical protein